MVEVLIINAKTKNLIKSINLWQQITIVDMMLPLAYVVWHTTKIVICIIESAQEDYICIWISQLLFAKFYIRNETSLFIEYLFDNQ